jgi:hypothetical protein
MYFLGIKMNAIKILFFGVSLFTGIAHADASKACAENCASTSQVEKSLEYTVMDIDGKPVKVVTVGLPSSAEFIGAIGSDTKAQLTETEHGSQMMAEGGPRSSKPGATFMDIISKRVYTTETHFVTVRILGSYVNNNEGIPVLLDITTQISKKPKTEDKEQKG